MSLAIQPITIKAAQKWVSEHHRHLPRVRGGLWACAVTDNGRLCGVAVVGNPARMAQDGWTCEVTRCATDGTRNACSFLYARARRVAQMLGYHRVLTKTLPVEGGASLRAVEATQFGLTRDEEWGRKARPRKPAVLRGTKVRWNLLPAQVKADAILAAFHAEAA